MKGFVAFFDEIFGNTQQILYQVEVLQAENLGPKLCTPFEIA